MALYAFVDEDSDFVPNDFDEFFNIKDWIFEAVIIMSRLRLNL